MKYSKVRKQIILSIMMYEYGKFVDHKIIRKVVKYACRLSNNALDVSRNALKNIALEILL